MSDLVLVARPKALRQLVSALSEEPIVAVDTESNSLHAYQEQVCLIQFSTPRMDYLVDPLALDDLSPLGEVFASPRIEKVFHAAEYDVITLKRDFGFTFSNLFDTMVAARILGWKQVGLGAILESEFGVRLDKRYQRANWGRRPLPGNMLDYARLDSHYLISLRHRMFAELKATGRLLIAREDFHRLQSVNGRDPEEEAEVCWRISGAYDLTGQQAAVLQELCRYRDQFAKSINRPLFKVMHDRTLYTIASACPMNIRQLQQLPSMTRKQVQRHGEAILQAVKRGLVAEPLAPPRSPRPDEEFLARVDALRAWRKKTARELGVNSDVVLPRDLLHQIAIQNPGCMEELKAILEQVPWRLERFGTQVLNVLGRT